MSDGEFDLFCIGLVLITTAFACAALVWVRWNEQSWQEFKRRHLIDDCPPELDDM